MYGGAAGGGKTDALLMSALMFSNVPGYAALCLRRTSPQLHKADSLIPRSHEWLAGTDAQWNEQKLRWTFPSGAILEFGHIQHERDKFSYQSAAYQCICFDELSQFTETQYRYLLSRLRRTASAKVPLRVRSASNPGGIGHEWVKQRFRPDKPDLSYSGCVFIPARLSDNPYLDREAYAETLSLLDPITRAQLLDGDWSARNAGGLFRREWFDVVEHSPINARRVRYWDLAATEATPGKDPDYTVGTKMSRDENGILYVEDVRRTRSTPDAVERLVKQTAALDGVSTSIWIEQEPGSSGKATIDHYRRNVLPGYAVRGDRVTGSKIERAGPFSAQAEGGNIKLRIGPWIGDWLDELEIFPEGAHDDQVDSASGCVSKLCLAGMSWGDALRMAETSTAGQ